jgi:Family of unknown function (DUF6917)
LSARRDPHEGGVLDTDYPYAAKRSVEGVLVCVLDARAPMRNLELTVHPSRALLRGEIHELLLTDDPLARPGQIVPNIAYGGCVEITTGGMVLVHDRLIIDGRDLGEIVGFDETHLPNHMNIAVRADGSLLTGAELGLQLEMPVRFDMGAAYHSRREESRQRS